MAQAEQVTAGLVRAMIYQLIGVDGPIRPRRVKEVDSSEKGWFKIPWSEMFCPRPLESPIARNAEDEENVIDVLFMGAVAVDGSLKEYAVQITENGHATFSTAGGLRGCKVLQIDDEDHGSEKIYGPTLRWENI